MIAREEAIHSRTGFLEPEHLLLGILQADPELAKRLSPPLTIEHLRNRANLLPVADGSYSEPPPGYMFKRILAYAGGEALKHNAAAPIRVAHLITGLLKEHDCWCARELRLQLIRVKCSGA